MPAVSIFRFEYEIMPNMNMWNVFIGAFTQQEAIDHLQRTVNKPIRITSTTMVCRLDDVSAGVRQNIISAFLNASGNKAEAKPAEVKPVEAKKEVKK